MAIIRLTIEFSFEAAHALGGYDGPCREIHGHSYRLFVTIKGEPSTDPTNPADGAAMAENGYTNLENYLNSL